jgi:hypothetical protein
MMAVPEPKMLRLLSLDGSVLPGLVRLTERLSEKHLAQLDDKLIVPPKLEVTYRFTRTFRWVAEIIQELPLTQSKHPVPAENARRHILENTELLMHEVSAFAEYLTRLLSGLAGDDRRKEKAALASGRRLSHEVVHLFKLPINKLKHDGFRLSWCEARYNTSVIAGFTVHGRIGKGVTGPAHFHPKAQGIAEGYSFPLLLRKTIETLYQLCFLTEAALLADIEVELRPEPAANTTTSPGLLAAASEALLLLPTLGRHGFPLENRHELLELLLDLNTVRVMRTFKLSPLKAGARITFHHRVTLGETVKPPFWPRSLI